MTTLDYCSSKWCELTWTPWIPFPEPALFKDLPAQPGVYRIRAIQGNTLFYIGETGRSLRERLGDLRRNATQAMMPFNDPHTAAPSLWAWRHAEGIDFECSAAPVKLADTPEEARRLREGLECYLLWQYRLATGSSTVCNHGRFHARYTKSTDRKKGLRGHRLPDDAPAHQAAGPSMPPLTLRATPFDPSWMGLSWSSPFIPQQASFNKVPSSPGLYKICDDQAKTLLYIGESKDLRIRLTTHTRKVWDHIVPCFSYIQLSDTCLAYQRHEWENDLIGAYYAVTKQVPLFQFLNHR